MKRLNNWIVSLGAVTAATAISVIVWFSWTTLMDDSPPSQIVATVRVGSPLIMKYYSSIEELSEDADIVIVGTVSGVAETGMDRGRDGTGSPIPYTVYAVEVVEALKGEADGNVYVVRRPPEVFPREPLTNFQEGETAVMYLYESSSVFVPTLTVTDTFYAPLAFDNAVFDILSSGDIGAVGRVNGDTIAVPRGTGPSMFEDGTTFTMSDLRDAIGAGSDEAGPVGNANN